MVLHPSTPLPTTSLSLSNSVHLGGNLQGVERINKEVETVAIFKCTPWLTTAVKTLMGLSSEHEPLTALSP